MPSKSPSLKEEEPIGGAVSLTGTLRSDAICRRLCHRFVDIAGSEFSQALFPIPMFGSSKKNGPPDLDGDARGQESV